MKLLLMAFAFFFLALPAHAAISINEFSSSSSPDWVEIYNSSTESAQLSEYFLRDSTDSDANKHVLSGTMGSGGFFTIDVSNELNNGGDKVRLFKVTGGTETLIEEIGYGDQGSMCVPSDTQSIGRLPDGGANIVRFASFTKGSSNNANIENCPAPTATPTPGPTNTPRPPNTPTPGATNTPAPSPIPTVAPTPRRTPTPTPVIVVPTIGEQEFTNAQENTQGQLLALEDTPSVLGESTAKPKSILPMIVIGAGAIGLVVSLVLLYRHSRSESSMSDPGPINLG